MSEYLKLAEMIGKSIDSDWFCCTELPKEEAYEFTKWFKPTENEMIDYNHDRCAWMIQYGAPTEQNNDFRILALCLMHEISLTEGRLK